MMSTTDPQLRVPDDLSSSQSKLVYLALYELEEATVTELQQRLNLSKLTLLAVLDSLTAKDHAQRTATGYACQ